MLNLEQLRKIVRESTDSRGSDFYRSLFRVPENAPSLNIRSWDEWRTLPPLTKQRIADVPIAQRMFLPQDKLDTISITSGTTGGPPIFYPRSYQGTNMEDVLARYPEIQGAVLSGIRPFPHEHERSLETLGREVRTIQFDPKIIHVSMALAAIAGVEVIIAQTYFITAMCGAAQETGLADRVRLIIGSGQSWTRSEFHHVAQTFPNAEILIYYGTREAGVLAYTGVLEDDFAVTYQAFANVYLELIDHETGEHIEPTSGAEGELLVTTTIGEPSAFPLLRYRIGDYIRVVSADESIADFSFQLLGRPQQEFIKVPGGILRVDELERVVGNLSGKISDRFEAHCFEKDTPDGPKKTFVIHVEPLPGATLDEIAQDISLELHLGPSFTYDDGVKKGSYLPLSCAVLPENPGNTKRKRIVKHW